MTTVTVLAPDSAMAMDEVIRQLGPNAYILSTTHRDGQIEIKATTEEPEHHSAKVAKVVEKTEDPSITRAFQELIEKNGGAEAAEAKAAEKKERPTLRSVPGGLDETTRVEDPPLRKPAPTAPEVALTPMQTAFNDVVDALERLKGMTSAAGDEHPLLRRLGFDEGLIASLAPTAASHEGGFEKGFVAELSQKVVAPSPLGGLEAPVILVAGSSGSGKTVMAAKIAALLMETRPEKTISLISLGFAQSLGDSPLAAYARLLKLPHEDWQSDKISVSGLNDPSTTRIIDINLEAEAFDKTVATLQRVLGEQALKVIVALPAGSSVERISAELNKYQDLSLDIALSKLDEYEMTPREISAIASVGSRIAWLSGTRSLTGTLAPASVEMMKEFLEGLVVAQD